MFERIRQAFAKPVQESLADLDIGIVTSQQSVEPETNFGLFFPATGILPPSEFKLPENMRLYLDDDLAFAICQTAAYLTVSPIETISESDELNSYLRDFVERIELETALFRMLIDINVFGFAGMEIVTNASTFEDGDEILGLKRIHPLTLLVKANQKGQHEFYIQRPSFATGSLLTTPFIERRLDPQTVIFANSWSPHTLYGQSLLQPIKARLAERGKLLESAAIAARNHANPLISCQYQMNLDNREDKNEVKNQLANLKKQAKAVQDNKSRFLLTAGRGEYRYTNLGFNSIPDSTPLINYETAACIIASGLNPQLLGYSTGGFTASVVSERVTINNIQTLQRNMVNGLSKLFDVLPFIEPRTPAGKPKIRMQEVDVVSLKEKYEAVSVQTNNSERHLRSGMITGLTAANQLGYDKPADEDRLEEFLEGPDPQEMQNKNDPNDNQAVDAAVRKGNNPTGKKG